jgi:16S rRNA (uracil1498-N3)-methyltransferase
MGQGAASMIRLFVQDDLAAGRDVLLSGDHAHYLVNVMRQGVGAPIALFNGRDGEWRAVIVEASRRACRVALETRTREQTRVPDLELLVSVVKRSRLETIVEKAAELGAARVRPVLTRRTNADRVRTDRLAAIMVEAAEQCERLEVPAIDEPEKLDRLLDRWNPSRRLIFCDEGGEAQPALSALAALPPGPAAILIGPEGGFSPEERARLRAMPGVTPVTLGPRILRADTAAICALTLYQATGGDWR